MAAVTVDVTGQVAIIRIGTDGSLPLAPESLDELDEAVGRLDTSGNVRCIVLTGAGANFATGADLRRIAANTADQNLAYNRRLIDVFDRFATVPIPTIASINGAAIGGGLELALACDLRIAAESARVGLPEVRLGLIPGAGGTQRLGRLVGQSAALDLLLTGRTISASEALALGVIGRCVPDDRLLEETNALADRLARNSPLAMAAIKRLVRDGASDSLPRALDLTQEALTGLVSARDLSEGVDAFLTKREPQF